MRLDVFFYALGIACFALTVYIPFYEVNFITAAFMIVLILFGLLFMAFGYSTRPRAYQITRQPPPPVVRPPEETKPHEEEAPQAPTPKTAAPRTELTSIKGIGPKRLAQLNALQITSVEDLAQWSAKNLATKTGISAKTTAKWIKEAKQLLKKGS